MTKDRGRQGDAPKSDIYNSARIKKRKTGDKAYKQRNSARLENTSPQGKQTQGKQAQGKPAHGKPGANTEALASEQEGRSETDDTEKLQKVLARAGLGSRREMERAISDGKAKVNGQLAQLGCRVSADDRVEFDGKFIPSSAKTVQRVRVILYNKPEGEICSQSDPEGRPTVFERLPRLQVGRWVSVGRLDFNTSGLLLFTNEGELANALMHPSTEIDREYLVRVQGEVDRDMQQRLREGVLLEDGVAKFSDLKVGREEETSNNWFYCVLMEGRNREVRRLWESQGVRVSRLKRVRFGNIFIPSHVRAGQWLELNEREVAELYLTANLEPPTHTRYSPLLNKTRERHQRKLRAGKQRVKRPRS